MSQRPAILCEGLGHDYGSRTALDDVDLRVGAAETFALLGPNGSGKSTLFRILATLLRPSRGTASIFGRDVREQPRDVRRSLGVTFQSASLDGKLTVRGNLTIQGRLYGLGGARLAGRVSELLERMGLTDRAGERAETLSGGLARRVDLAKALLHEPALLLLDEPSTGLDPGARGDLLAALLEARDAGTSVLLTTHFTDEAARCDRVGILDRGRVVASDTPGAMVREIGADVITLETEDPARLAADVQDRLGSPVTHADGSVRIERDDGPAILPEILAAFSGRVLSATIAQPTLEDVFFRKTGRRWRADGRDG